MRENDQSGKLLHIVNTWCVQVLRSPNLFKKNYAPQEAENAVISQRNHPVDVHIFHNAHATIAWPQQTLLWGFVLTTGKSLLQERNDLKMCDHEECPSVLETAKNR